MLAIKAVFPDVVDDLCGTETITLLSLNRFCPRETSTKAFGKTTNIFDHLQYHSWYKHRDKLSTQGMGGSLVVKHVPASLRLLCEINDVNIISVCS